MEHAVPAPRAGSSAREGSLGKVALSGFGQVLLGHGIPSWDAILDATDGLKVP